MTDERAPGVSENASAGDVPSSWVTILTTEHYNLQTQRAATITETIGRASLFMGAVSAGLIALGFSLGPGLSNPGVISFGVTVLSALTFLGIITFFRTVQTSVDDAAYAGRIEILRDSYEQLFPGLAPLLAKARGQDSYLTAARRGIWQRFVTVSASIAMITSILAGSVVGLVAFGLSGELVLALGAAVVVVVPTAIALFSWQRRQWVQSAVLRE